MRSNSSRRTTLLSALAAVLLLFFIFSSFRNIAHTRSPPVDVKNGGIKDGKGERGGGGTEQLLTGKAIAPKLGNATAKAELGRAAWKLFHTTFARFPDKPTEEESEALRTYIHLFQRLYPCGECAQHFGTILEKFPPQVKTRSTAAAWGCHVHNEVNKSLKKELWDCSNIGDFYDCGCAEDGMEKKGDLRKEVRSAGVREELEVIGWTKGG